MSSTAKLFDELVAATPPDVRQRVDWSFSIADKISGILKRRGLTQQEFADMMGCSQAEVSRWCGGVHNFTLSTLAKISTTLGEPMIMVAE